MHLFKYLWHGILFISVACSQLPTEHSPIVVSAVADPSIALGFKGNNLKEMVEKSKALGGKAAEFLATDLFIQGNDASIHDDHQTAAQLFRYVVELCPKDTYLRKKLSVELIRIGELQEAEKILETIFAESSKDKHDNTIGLILAGVYAAQEKSLLARGLYQKILDSKSEDIEEACLFLAKSYAVEKQYKQAHSLLMKCEKRDRNDPIYTFYRGKIEEERGNKDKARNFFEKALKIDPSYFQATLALGSFFEKHENIPAAIKIYKKFLANPENSSNVQVLTQLVTLLFKIDDKVEVIPYAENLSSIDGSDLNLKVRLGLLYSDIAKYEEAINIFKDILMVAPESDKIIYYLGALYQQINRRTEAIDYFERITTSSPLYENAGLQIGQLLAFYAHEEFTHDQKIGNQTQNFINFTNRRIKENRESMVEFKVLQANFFEETSQLKLAIETMLTVKEHPSFSELHRYYLASIFEKDGQSSESRKIVQAIIDKDPNNAQALNFLGYSYLDKNEHLDLAFHFISKAVQLLPGDGYIRDSLAWYYFQVGKYREALVESKKAFELIKSDVIITKHLGMIYQQLKHFDKAKEYFTEALKLSNAKSEREDVLKSLIEVENMRRLPASGSK